MRLPAHLRSNDTRRWYLRKMANGLRGLFGEPVYLCGSALLDSNANPRDWDIRITLPDRVFAQRYGELLTGERMTEAKVMRIVDDWETQGLTGDWKAVRWRWSDECVKQSRQESERTGLNIDFQVYPKTHTDALYKTKPRARLDTRRMP